MTKKIFICAVLIFFTLVPNVQAQVVINEFSSSTSDDWIELFSSEDVNIGEWLIKDSSSQIGDKIPINTFIGPSTSKYYVFNAGNRLNGDGDEIKLYGKDGLTLINSVTYNDSGDICLPSQSGSIGRYPEDGNPTIDRFSNHTKNGSNSGAILDACPTPTPTNTPSPTPTNKPDATNTPSPTNTPVPTNTPSPTTKLTPTNTPTPIEEKDDGEVLGQAESIESNREKLIGEDEIASPDLAESDKEFPIVAGLFVIGGLMFIIGAGYLYFKSQKIENGESKTTKEDENPS